MAPDVTLRLLPLLVLAVLAVPAALAAAWPLEDAPVHHEDAREPPNFLFFLSPMLGLWPALVFLLGLIVVLVWRRNRGKVTE